MNDDDEFDDDYVARLLAEDAKKTSQKYATQGLAALLPQRRAADAPKPNTRFLNHIVRDADQHNAALKRKEEREASRRLKALHDQDKSSWPKKRRPDETDMSKRKRMLDDILGATTQDRVAKSRRTGQQRSPSHERPPHRLREERGSHRRRHRRRHRRSRSHSRSHSHGRRSRSPSRERGYRERPASKTVENDSRASDTDPSRPSRQQHNLSDQGKRITAAHVKVREMRPDQATLDEARGVGSSSHELSPTIGGTVRIRGRGAYRHGPRIDDHFATDYNPNHDVSLDSDHNEEDEDWDLALEAMRDRLKWKENKVARMREVGFDEKDLSQLESAGAERDPNRVKWSTKGEVREWDVGKR